MAMAANFNDYDVSPLIQSVLGPLAAAGIDPQEALKNPEAAYRALDQKQAGVASSTVQPAPAPVRRGPRGPGIEDDFGTGRSRYIPPEPGWNPSMAPGGAHPATVPASVSNTGREETATPSPAAAFQPAQSTLASAQQGYQDTLAQRREAAEKLKANLEARQQLTRDLPNPQDQQYRPSVGRRIARGLIGAGLGLAEHGLAGAAAGALNPKITSGTGYGDPNSQFSQAMRAWQQRNETLAQEHAGVEEQQKNLEGQEKDIGGLSETGGRQATVGKDITDAEANANKPGKPSDKMVHAYTGADGKQHLVFQAEDNSTYEKAFGDVNEKEPQSIDAAALAAMRAQNGGQPPTLKQINDYVGAKARESRPPRAANELETWMGAFKKQYGRDPSPEEIGSRHRAIVYDGLTSGEQRMLQSKTRRLDDERKQLLQDRSMYLGATDDKSKEQISGIDKRLDEIYAAEDRERENIISGRPKGGALANSNAATPTQPGATVQPATPAKGGAAPAKPRLQPGSTVNFNGKPQKVTEVRRNPKTGEHAYNIGGQWYRDSELTPNK